jgi:hypothetical protein
MADYVRAEQTLKEHPRIGRYPARLAFSGWSRRSDMADYQEKTEQLSRPA